jgi:hypothetical protein
METSVCQVMRRGISNSGQGQKACPSTAQEPPGAHPTRLSLMLLAQSAKSQGLGDSVPKWGRRTG